MSIDKEPQFTHSIILATNGQHKKELDKRFKNAARWYNLLLKEYCTRAEFLRCNPGYRAARRDFAIARSEEEKLKKRKKPTKEEREALQTANAAAKDAGERLDAYRRSIPGMPHKSLTSWYDATKEPWYIKVRTATFGKSLLVQPANTIGKEAYLAAMRYLKTGKRKFRKWSDRKAINGNQDIKLRESDGNYFIVWGRGFKVPIVPQHTEHFYHALAHRGDLGSIKILGRADRYEIRLTCKGLPIPAVKSPSDKTVGIDVNVSNVGVSDDQGTELVPMSCNTPAWAQLRRLQRKASRQEMASFSPEARKRIQGAKTPAQSKAAWGFAKAERRKSGGRSKSHLKTLKAIAALHLRTTATAKQHTNTLAKDIGSKGVVRAEKLVYTGWQKRWGKKTLSTRPGALMDRLRKITKVEEFSTYSTKLSQTCVCGEQKKKALRERTHRCGSCGLVVARDKLSAFLARHVENDVLNLNAAQESFRLGQLS